MALSEKSTSQGTPALEGTNTANGDGVVGVGRRGVVGLSEAFQGVYGHSGTNAGVVGESEQFDGVFGVAKDPARAGVSGHNSARGLAGWFDGHVVVTGHQGNFPSLSGNNDTGGDGVTGTAIANGRGVVGIAKGNQAGVVGESQGFDGVFGVAHDKNRAGVSGHNTNAGGLAGFFGGNVVATGDVTGGGASLKQLSETVQQLKGTIQQQGAAFLAIEGQIANLASRLSAAGL
ncbi:hypothetical protein ACQP0C_42005 (plasmid) [Nocardia sp. CA-129566]|uniref:hypothetical protein n=1 Tax=Nocardia sp. CA-129566 TaxID=3239976 RepID=UPI003D989392